MAAARAHGVDLGPVSPPPAAGERKVATSLGLGCLTAALGVAVLLVQWADQASARVLFFGCVELGLLLAGGYLVVKRPAVGWGEVGLATAATIVALVAGEALLGLRGLPAPILLGWKYRDGLGGKGSQLEVNELGFRGQSIRYSENDRVVVLLGDSSVEAVACAFDWMPERRLEYHLRSQGAKARVFSLAAGGYGQDQQLLALEEYYERFRADIVILWQDLGNDVWNNMFPTHWPANGRPKPTFWLEKGKLRGPTGKIGGPLPMPRLRTYALWLRLFSRPSWDQDWERLLPPAYVPAKGHTGPINHAWQIRWDRNIGYMRDENLATEKSHLAMGLKPRSPRMAYGIALTRQLIERIETRVRSRSGTFLILNIETPVPTAEAGASRPPGDEVYGLNGSYYLVSGEQLETNQRDINEGFRRVIVPVRLPRWRVGPEDSHLNEHAVDEAMADLGRKLSAMLS